MTSAASHALPALPRPGAMLRPVPDAAFGRELAAGATLAALCLPLNIGYAEAAGLPAAIGINASLLPLLVFAVFSGSRGLFTGPDATISALLAAVLPGVAAGAGTQPEDAALAIALLTGVFLLAMWAAKAGGLVRYISKPVLIGFLAGLGIEILTSQVERMLAISVDSDAWLTDLVEIVELLPDASLASAVVGASTVAIVRLCRRFVPSLPGPLAALLVVGGAVALWDPGGVALLDDIPSELPSLSWPSVPFDAWPDLAGTALAIAALTVTEGVLMGGSSARRHGDRFDANGELFALGAANVAATVTSGMPIGASASRTAALDSAGGRSQIPAVVAAALIAAVVLVFNDAVEAIPTAALAGLVANAVVSIIDVGALRELARVRRSELLVALGCTAGVLALGPIGGLVVAVLASSIDLVRRIATSPWTELSAPAPSDWSTDRFSATRREAEPTPPGVTVLRVTGPLFFANADVLRAQVGGLVARPGTEWVVLDFGAVTDIDPTAREALVEVAELARGRGTVLALTRVTAPVRGLLERYGLSAVIPPAQIFPSTRAAMAAFASAQRVPYERTDEPDERQP